MAIQNFVIGRLLGPLTWGLMSLPLISSCGNGSGELEPAQPLPLGPTIRNIGFTTDVTRGEFTTLSQSIFAPGGISAADNAITLTWIPPMGPSIITEFSAEQANCTIGAIECISSFQPLVPADLPVAEATYEVIYTARDQQGLSTDFLRLVFVSR